MIRTLLSTVHHLRNSGFCQPALVGDSWSTSPKLLHLWAFAGVKCTYNFIEADVALNSYPLETKSWQHLNADVANGRVDSVIIRSREQFPLLMRVLSEYLPGHVPVVPLNPDWVVSGEQRKLTAYDAAWVTTSATNYVARVGLRGHYLEFGTFYGRSFFQNYFHMRDWLKGRFYAFESFEGLIGSDDLERSYSGGDFYNGAYRSSPHSFKAIGSCLGVDWSRIRVVPGPFEDTLDGDSLERLGVTKESISVMYVDCDLRNPTAHILATCEPYLEDGALIYFDDWRLCRASSKVGERAAAISWLRANPNVELVELDRSSWQSQWFIFARH